MVKPLHLLLPVWQRALDGWRSSIRVQLISGFGLAAWGLMSLAGWVLHEQQRNALYAETVQQATTLANALARSSSSWVLVDDLAGLQEIVWGLRGTMDLKQVFVLSPTGQVLASTQQEVVGLFVSDPVSRELLHAAPEIRVLVDEPQLVDVAAPVRTGQRLIGWVRVELTRDKANADLRRQSYLWAGFVLAGLLLVTLVSVLLSRRLLRGLSRLVEVATAVKQGQTDARAKVANRDEIAVLAQAFNTMLDSLQESNLRFGQLAENVNEVFWMKDPRDGRMLYVSPAYERIWGRPVQSLLDDPASWQEAVFEKDRERVTKALLERQISGTYDEQYRIVRSDGAVRWIHHRAFPVKNEQGEVYRLVGVTEDVTERREAEENIQWLAHFDSLTGLPNRNLLNDRISQAISIAQRSQTNLALMFLDLDNFKNVNDSLGHRIGDALLVQVARRLRGSLREEDTVSRLGGDEFILLLPGTDADGAAQVARKLIDEVTRPCQIEHHVLTVTPSIGIAIYPSDGESFEELSKRADVAMYRAKRDGRNDYRFFTPEMQTRANRALELENALRHALARNELHLQYQPQLSMADGRIVGAEALLRWRHPQWGLVSPAEFIPVAEDSGQILPIGEWVLRTAVAQLKVWRDRGLPSMVMAVNLSVVQFRHAGLPELVARILEEAELPPRYLELELTEGVAMEDPQSAIEMMDRLHECGVLMSIDDFGTGYSSLSYLKRFKIHKLKIDQSFVRDIGVDPEDKAIVSAIISLADSLDMQTIAEGVETQDQLQFLRERGCDEGQGYFFSKPLPADEFEAFVRSRAPQSVVWWKGNHR